MYYLLYLNQKSLSEQKIKCASLERKVMEMEKERRMQNQNHWGQAQVGQGREVLQYAKDHTIHWNKTKHSVVGAPTLANGSLRKSEYFS
jgi:hypothetical protein